MRHGEYGLAVLMVCAGLGLGACTRAQFERVRVADGGGRPLDAADAANGGGRCTIDAPRGLKGKAQTCTCDDECASGFCADGVCCTSACGETCKACNLASALGDCAFIPAGGKPADPAMCAASAPRTCGQDGTCDGKGACRRYARGTECQPGRCDGNRVADIMTCDGDGQCSQRVSQTCPPYNCDAASKQCAVACTSDAECATGQHCAGNRCGRSGNGASCQSASDCASGFCVGGVCCNVGCNGPCMVCNQTGSVGECTPVLAGLPDPACQAADVSTCGRTGLCDGMGSCTLYPENTVCGPATCSGGEQTAARTCDGHGTCRSAELVDCSPFTCSGGVCQSTCDPNQPSTCVDGRVCTPQLVNGKSSGVCGPRKNGQSCWAASECESGSCVDGVCCESDCTGACMSCNLPGSPGRCLVVAAGAPDPRRACQDAGAAACSTNGLCDGKGACQSYPAGTVCGRQTCAAGAYSPPPTCNAAGQCVASRSRTCSPFTCNGDTCFSACSSNAECAEGEFCSSGSCGLKPLGATCAGATDCSSGFCAQGVCCDSACTGACLSCSLLASAGTCTPVADGVPDPQGQCATTAPATCGTTGTCRKGACAYHEAGLNCGPAVCASSTTLTPAATCDGKGNCSHPANLSCGAFACVGDVCKASCSPATQAADCVAPNTCINSSCGRKADGAACTAAAECQSGFCSEGVCCDSACADATGGLCKTCRGTRSSPVGTCGKVDSGGRDPKSRCGASSPDHGDCANDGTCDGAGACRPWSSGTGCRKESCSGSTHILAATCDGLGNCPPAVTSSCGAYVCSATSPTCLNTCTSDVDCTNRLTCLKTSNRCGDKLSAGEACVASTDCGTGLVCSAEGVCCDQACAGGCQSCKLPGKAGVCANLPAATPPRASASPTCTPGSSGGCGATGNCDGNGGCEQRTTCSVSVGACPTDPHSEYTTTGVCSAGSCTPQTRACGAGYLCAGGACATSCTTANASSHCDVAAGYACIGGFCQKKGNGTTCGTGAECTSGRCVDGVCCASSSCPDCQACNLAGHEGTCWNVPANSADGNCTGTCPSATQARGLCDGAGACRGTTSCPTGYACTAGLCGSSCAKDADCAPGYACATGGTCKRSLGQSCSGNGECASGNCIDGRCCSTTSCADCLSCDVAGHEGTCTAVAAGTADGACVASCVGSQLGGLCDGSGNCRPPAACPNGYLCNNNTQCATSCTTSCAAGFFCSGGSCVAAKANGQTCAAGGECASGSCVDGVCCASASCATCLSCNVSGHLGTCSAVAAGAADGDCVASCPAGSDQQSGLCDGAGTCRAATTCPGGNRCGTNGQCATDCTSAGCSTGYYCSGTTCVALKADGATCAADAECSHGHCISNGTAKICCSTTCTDVTCGTRALCNTTGMGCQSYGDGSACSAGSATCATDGRSLLSSSGTCAAGVCSRTVIACTVGYLCVKDACVAPGACKNDRDCDATNGYTCNRSGNCVLGTSVDAG